MSEQKFKSPEEWFKQADYDMETAQAMLDSGRYIYSIYMSHLSIEKAFKGIFASVHKKDPPKTHNFNYLINKFNEIEPINLSEAHEEFIDFLNEKVFRLDILMY